MLIINLIETLLIKISNNEFINNIISLVLRSLLSEEYFILYKLYCKKYKKYKNIKKNLLLLNTKNFIFN